MVVVFTNMKLALGGPVAADKLIAKQGKVWRKTKWIDEEKSLTNLM